MTSKMNDSNLLKNYQFPRLYSKLQNFQKFQNSFFYWIFCWIHQMIDSLTAFQKRKFLTSKKYKFCWTQWGQKFITFQKFSFWWKFRIFDETFEKHDSSISNIFSPQQIATGRLFIIRLVFIREVLGTKVSRTVRWATRTGSSDDFRVETITSWE